MKKNNLIALIIVSVIAIVIILWKSGVFSRSGKKETSDNDVNGNTSGPLAFPSSPYYPARQSYEVPASPSVNDSAAKIPEPMVRDSRYDSRISTLNSPEMLLVNQNKKSR